MPISRRHIGVKSLIAVLSEKLSVSPSYFMFFPAVYADLIGMDPRFDTRRQRAAKMSKILKGILPGQQEPQQGLYKRRPKIPPTLRLWLGPGVDQDKIDEIMAKKTEIKQLCKEQGLKFSCSKEVPQEIQARELNRVTGKRK